MRTIIHDVVEARRKIGDANLHYLDGLELFGQADAGDLPDDLHPNGVGYVRMGERFNARAFGAGWTARGALTSPLRRGRR